MPPKPEIAQLQGFYCVFKWQYLDILREKATEIYFRRLWERKITSISSPDRIFNSWQGFYCSFMWQYLDILREKAKKIFLKALGEEKYKYFQPKLGYPPIASKAVGLAMYRKKNFSHERAILWQELCNWSTGQYGVRL